MNREPAEQSPLHKWSVLIVAVLSFALDQLTKSWARQSLGLQQSTPFIPGLLCFHLTTNTGAAFSLGADNGTLMTVLATSMTAALIIWTVQRQKKNPSLLEKIGMGCLIGGAIGNLFDRFTRGRVTDFLDFVFVSFPVFNVADALIDSGMALLFISAMRQQSPPRETETSPESGSQT